MFKVSIISKSDLTINLLMTTLLKEIKCFTKCFYKEQKKIEISNPTGMFKVLFKMRIKRSIFKITKIKVTSIKHSSP